MNYFPAATLSLVWKNFKTSNFSTKTNWESIGDYINSYFIQYMCLWGNSTTLVYNEIFFFFFAELLFIKCADRTPITISSSLTKNSKNSIDLLTLFKEAVELGSGFRILSSNKRRKVFAKYHVWSRPFIILVSIGWKRWDFSFIIRF